MSKEEIDVRVGDIWKDKGFQTHWLIYGEEERPTGRYLWAVQIEQHTEDADLCLVSTTFKDDTLIYREPTPMTNSVNQPFEVKDWHTLAMTNSVGQPFKVDDPGRSFTAEQVENMTLKELGLQVKGRENDAWGTVGVYIEVPNSPDVCLNLKHTTLKGATIIVTESFAV